MKRPNKFTQLRLKAAVVAIAACFAQTIQANPTAPTVVGGSATFATAGNTLSVTNTPGAIINWQQFNIGQGEITKFIQQSAQSTVLNRVLGQDPSQILGTLQTNGTVFLVNPSGVLFGQGSVVNVNGLVASTLNISDSDFLLNRLNFIGGNGGSVVNQGNITTPLGGSVYLIGNSVKNEGVITSPKGEVILAAGNSVSLLDTGTPHVTVTLNAPDNQTVNLGQIVAEGGNVNIYGALINQQGVIRADSASLDAQGNIVLKATDATTVSGTLSATNSQGKGGSIQVLGNNVTLTGTAQIDASGATGGGTVLVGGDNQGKNAAVQNALNTTMVAGAAIHADATATGNGGKVILWSNNHTDFSGSITAKGGANGGDGGFVETSGHTIALNGRVDTLAPMGKTGNWLIDPDDYTIAPTGGNITGAALSSNLISTGITIQTTSGGTGGNGDIFVNDVVSWNSGNTLTLNAYRNIEINSPISSNNGHLALTAAGNVRVRHMVQTNTMNVSGTNIYVEASPSQPAMLGTLGTQTITASQGLYLTAASTGAGRFAMIGSYGDQTINANGITLTGGGTGSTDADNFAMIVHDYCYSFNGTNCAYTGTGSQAINLTGSGAFISASGGAGSGTSTYYNSACTAAGLGTLCYGSNNSAEIRSQLGTQTINFANTGGSISLLGGTVGSGNWARISNDQWQGYNGGTLVLTGPLPGEQKILGLPDINLTGGASGGRTLYYNSNTHSFDNSASIETRGGLQTIRARNITLNGSASGASSTAVAGAFLGGDPESGNFIQDIWATGNVAITGGASTTGTAANDSTKSDMAAAAAIYADAKASGATAASTIRIDGALTMTGGASAYSPAIIGSKAGSSFNIHVGGAVTLDTGSNASSILIGSFFQPNYVDWSTYANSIGINTAINSGSLFTARTPGTLGIASTGSVNAADVSYQANDMALAGATTATSASVGISAYNSSRSILIETTPTNGVLSLTPAEIATLHSPSSHNINIGNPYGSGTLTVAASIDSSHVNAGDLHLNGSGVTVNAPISLSPGLVFESGSGGVYFNAPVSVNNTIRFYLNGGGVSQSSTAPIAATRLVASGNGYVVLNGSHTGGGNNNIGAVAANLTGGGFWLNNGSSTSVASIEGINGITAYHIGIHADGNLTLNAPLVATGTGDVYIDYYNHPPYTDPLCTGTCVRPHIELGADGSFTNNVGAGVFTLPTGKFWSLVADKPSTTTLNGLAPDAVTYDAISITGDILVSANRVFYARQDTTTAIDPCIATPALCATTTTTTTATTNLAPAQTVITPVTSGATGDITYSPDLKLVSAGGEVTYTPKAATDSTSAANGTNGTNGSAGNARAEAKKADVEAKKAETEAKEAEAQVKSAKTPQQKAQAKKHAEEKKAEAEEKKAEAEVKKAEAEAKEAEAEVKTAKTSGEKTQAEVKKSTAEGKKAEAEGKKAEVEAKKADAEMKQAEGDAKKAEAEAKVAKTPEAKALAKDRAEASKSEAQDKKADVVVKKAEVEVKKAEAELKKAELA